MSDQEALTRPHLDHAFVYPTEDLYGVVRRLVSLHPQSWDPWETSRVETGTESTRGRLGPGDD